MRFVTFNYTGENGSVTIPEQSILNFFEIELNKIKTLTNYHENDLPSVGELRISNLVTSEKNKLFLKLGNILDPLTNAARVRGRKNYYYTARASLLCLNIFAQFNYLIDNTSEDIVLSYLSAVKSRASSFVHNTSIFYQGVVEQGASPKSIDKGSESDLKVTNFKMKEDKNMSEIVKQSFLEEITEAADEAQYRIYQRQAMKRIKDAIYAMLKKNNSSRSEFDVAKKFLDSKIGEGIICALIGFGGSRVPLLADSEKAQRVLKEFKVEGMAVVGDDIVERLMGMILPAFGDVINEQVEKLPSIVTSDKKKKTRIAMEEDESLDEHKAIDEAEKKPLRAVATSK